MTDLHSEETLDKNGVMRHNKPAKGKWQTYILRGNWIKNGVMRHNRPAEGKSQTYILRRHWIKNGVMRHNDLQEGNHRLTYWGDIGSRMEWWDTISLQKVNHRLTSWGDIGSRMEWWDIMSLQKASHRLTNWGDIGSTMQWSDIMNQHSKNHRVTNLWHETIGCSEANISGWLNCAFKLKSIHHKLWKPCHHIFLEFWPQYCLSESTLIHNAQ